MSDFDPGEGWRKVPDGEDVKGEVLTLTNLDDDGVAWQRWVREEPVPPLPTEPYTVIRVTWDERHKTDWPSVLALGVDHDWAWSPVGGPGLIDVNDLPKWITGFEVLAEPRMTSEGIPHETDMQFEDRVRRETAKAVLERVAELIDGMTEVETMRREFGVES